MLTPGPKVALNRLKSPYVALKLHHLITKLFKPTTPPNKQKSLY
jgi:hypothetical protein